jgi:hypothetical protein
MQNKQNDTINEQNVTQTRIFIPMKERTQNESSDFDHQIKFIDVVCLQIFIYNKLSPTAKMPLNIRIISL